MPPHKHIEDVYEYALELTSTHAGASAIGVAFTVTDAGPFAVAGACQIWDSDGEVIDRERMLECVAYRGESAETYARGLPERRTVIPAEDEPANLRYLIALAGIRACAVIRSELARLVEAGDHLEPG